MILDQVKAYPMLSAAIGILITLIKLGILKIPVQIPLVSPAKVEGDEHDPLRDRLEKAIVLKFDELVDSGEDADDAYGVLVKSVRNTQETE